MAPAVTLRATENSLVLMHSGIVNGYQLLSNAHTVQEQKGTVALSITSQIQYKSNLKNYIQCFVCISVLVFLTTPLNYTLQILTHFFSDPLKAVFLVFLIKSFFLLSYSPFSVYLLRFLFKLDWVISMQVSE